VLLGAAANESSAVDSGAGASGWEQSSIETEDERESLALQNIAGRY
jgi:hypothetical protein